MQPAPHSRELTCRAIVSERNWIMARFLVQPPTDKDTSMKSIVLVTCSAVPELNISERLYAEALIARGCRVSVAPWNGPADVFRTESTIILRSNWDFHYEPDAFLDWLMSLKESRKTVFNPPEVAAWNVDKCYLLDLASRGIRIPHTRTVPNDREAISGVFRELNWPQAVIKPSIGASGYDVKLVRPEELLRSEAGQTWTKRSPVIVQEFLPELGQGGEISCVFFDGKFSHSLLRQPAADEFRINSRYGGTTSLCSVSPRVVQQARGSLAVWDYPLLYARVDGVLRGGDFILTELEVNEPDLDLHLAPGAADRFADATLRRLDAPPEGSANP